MDLRDSSCSLFAILPAPAQCLHSTSLIFVGFVVPVVIVHSSSLSAKTSCSRFRCILGEFLVDLVLDV